jgi:23S rRNA pseudouridine2457 synthase
MWPRTYWFRFSKAVFLESINEIPFLNMSSTHRYFLLNKPYKMLSQFVGHPTGNMLGKIDFDFPEGTHAIGRLDNLSEGMLLLTTDKSVTKRLFNHKVPHQRRYLVQIDDKVTSENVEQLRSGVPIILRGNVPWITSPCLVEMIGQPDTCYGIENWLHPKHGYKWLKITLTEGKYHQIRKMMIAINNRCKRLIRTSIEDMEMGDLPVGHVREYSQEDFFKLLRLS